MTLGAKQQKIDVAGALFDALETRSHKAHAAVARNIVKQASGNDAGHQRARDNRPAFCMTALVKLERHERVGKLGDAVRCRSIVLTRLLWSEFKLLRTKIPTAWTRPEVCITDETTTTRAGTRSASVRTRAPQGRNQHFTQIKVGDMISRQTAFRSVDECRRTAPS
jgi:hypothetical protein